MLTKLTPGLNFINVLRTAFTPVVPKSVKIQLSHKYLFTLSGSTGAKAACRTLMKLTPERRQMTDRKKCRCRPPASRCRTLTPRRCGPDRWTSSRSTRSEIWKIFQENISINHFQVVLFLGFHLDQNIRSFLTENNCLSHTSRKTQLLLP